MAITEPRLSLEEFLQLPEEKPALEYIDGAVVQKVSPKARHSTLQAELLDRCNRVGLPRKIARAYPELRSTYSGQSTVPDVSIYRWERLPRTPNGRIADDFTEPPDIAVEIASPGEAVNALVRRCLWYVANGVRIALLVDPDDESVLAFQSERGPVALRSADRIVLDVVLPGFELTVGALFDSLNVD